MIHILLKIGLFVCATISIAAGPSFRAQAGQDPLRALINAGLSYSQDENRDEFSEPPIAGDHLGSEVSFSIPLNSDSSREPQNYLSSAFYVYEEGRLTAYLRHWSGTLEAFEPATVIPGRSYTGQNSFGVSTTVKVETILKGGISIVNVEDPSRLSWRSAMARRTESKRRGRSFIHVEQVSGSDARDLASGLRFKVVGRIATFPNGRSVACRSGLGDPPTRERPKDFAYHFCTVAVEATSISLVDGANGRVLRVWEGFDLVKGGH